MSKVFIEEATLTGIAEAIRGKEGSSEKISPLEMPARIEAIGGGLSLENKLTRISIYNLGDFGTKKVELTMPRCNSIERFYQIPAGDEGKNRVNTVVENLVIHSNTPIENAASFLNANTSNKEETLQKVTLDMDLSQNKNFNQFIVNMRALEEISGTEIDLTSATNTSLAFHLLYALREVRFKGIIPQSLDMKYSPLSKDSIVSVISCLSATATGKTLGLKLTAVDAAFETSPGAADGSESAEWTALIASKPNWTISLV